MHCLDVTTCENFLANAYPTTHIKRGDNRNKNEPQKWNLSNPTGGQGSGLNDPNNPGGRRRKGTNSK
ncbi:hypothetical protein O181_007924 [Austropuccinia psidii MF-1]|uniref:Uncharacterized protein n=1 Tax=Austropuccinia psidii MF-1 TaxID=1389203 RepID=A0A9Q3BLT0_9BASI|nr:hypothetical protein [Austropuccinia psidii MF-1]